MPRVSVVIPTYNRAHTVVACIESALAQSFTGLEVIVVDDGSSDDTGSVLKQAFGDRIRYYFQTNQGASVARNRGVEEAQGEWIAFLDSDDLWETDKLEWQFKALDQFAPACAACYTDVRFYNHPETRTMFELAESSYRHEHTMGVNSDVLRLLVKPGGAGMVVCLSSFLARTGLIRSIGGFNPTLLYSQDSEFMFRLAMLTGFCYVNRPLVKFDRAPAEVRHVGVATDWNRLDFFLNDSQLRLEGLMRLTKNQPPAIRALIRRQLGGIYSGWVNCHLETGQHGKARSSAFKAMTLDPNFNVAAKWLLTWISPRLALQAVRKREANRKDAVTV
jgi:glycosyltransferase involved in cell wall biosynthesis